MAHAESTAPTLQILRGHGITIIIDDFSTGYTSNVLSTQAALPLIPGIVGTLGQLEVVLQALGPETFTA